MAVMLKSVDALRRTVSGPLAECCGSEARMLTPNCTAASAGTGFLPRSGGSFCTGCPDATTAHRRSAAIDQSKPKPACLRSAAFEGAIVRPSAAIAGGKLGLFKRTAPDFAEPCPSMRLARSQAFSSLMPGMIFRKQSTTC